MKGSLLEKVVAVLAGEKWNRSPSENPAATTVLHRHLDPLQHRNLNYFFFFFFFWDDTFCKAAVQTGGPPPVTSDLSATGEKFILHTFWCV